jgi:5-(aminomethyl)-3-furanmethanol phosphate kinase
LNPYSVSVVKVGGSLFDWPLLPARLTKFLAARALERRQERIVLIAGGGGAADFVRLADRVQRLGEQRAHRLALHALDLTAEFLVAVLPGSFVAVDSIAAVQTAWTERSFPVLAPRRFIQDSDFASAEPLPENWDVTSDTIAARVASHLRADCLVLLKSAPLPPGATRRAAASLGLVDPIFPRAARILARVEYVNFRDSSPHLHCLPP